MLELFYLFPLVLGVGRVSPVLTGGLNGTNIVPTWGRVVVVTAVIALIIVTIVIVIIIIAVGGIIIIAVIPMRVTVTIIISEIVAVITAKVIAVIPAKIVSILVMITSVTMNLEDLDLLVILNSAKTLKNFCDCIKVFVHGRNHDGIVRKICFYCFHGFIYRVSFG